MSRFVVVFSILFCTAAPSQAQDTSRQAVTALYSSAVDSMRELRQPEYLTYTIEGEGDGLGVALTVENHLVWLEMTTYSSAQPTEPVTWMLRHRTDDYASEITEESGRRLVSTRPLFDPTWYGAFRALRDGMLDYQRPEPPISAYATPTPGPPTDLRTIAVVDVIGANIYSVADKGAALCDNGDQGRALHLSPRDRNPRHQLADVVVDLHNMHFCAMRFNVSDGGWRGSVEQHYSDVGGYWLQTGGTIESSVRALGILVLHGVWRYRLQGMTFPSHIPAEAFLRPLDQ